jgi:D-alanyl-D-alanine dipeptidase
MKTYKTIILLFFYSFCFISKAQNNEIPKDFINLKDSVPDINVELRYYSTNNFVGDTITGYRSNTLYLTSATVQKLKLVQAELRAQNLCLTIYDGYRPQRAVNQFIVWARDLNDTINKAEFYPNVKKCNLFNEGYIASRSGHSRGSTVDLTISNGETGQPLDMGSPYDFFGEASWVSHDKITKEQKKNRQLLQTVMLKHGFRNYAKEWWHFTLRNEPFPNTYFDFEIVD